MKIFDLLFLLIFLFPNRCFPQDLFANTFHLNKFPISGILLDKGWKFKPGDNSNYAKPGYDDKTWQYINPTLDIHDSLQQIPRSGIVWFRLHLLVDTVVNNHLVMMIQQSGASEIYLNGKLICHFGTLSTDPEKVRAFNPREKPVSFPIGSTSQQLLAVRYALQPNIFYSTHFKNENKGLYIIVNTLENALDQFEQIRTENDKRGGFWTGVFFILGILYLAFYLFYRNQKGNLYFSLYAFLSGGFWLYSIYSSNLNRVELSFPLNNLILILGVVTNLILLQAIYHLLEQKSGLVYYSLVVVGIISILCGVFIYSWGWLVSVLLFGNLIIIEIIRNAFTSVRQNKREAWIIAAGGIGFFIFWLLFVLQSFGFLSDYYIDFFSLALFCIPTSVAISLGYNFALINRTLQLKLREIETLSKENLEKEKNRQAAQIKAMISTQEEERKRISRDLHDDVGTKLSALNLYLSSLNEKATAMDNSEIKSLAQSSKQFIKEMMYDIRQLLLNLSPTVLEDFGYTAAVEGLVNKINETKQIHFDLVVFGMNNRLKKDYELALYRITQELINNVLKHAEAKHISLEIGQRDEKIILRMEDDGKGFDVDAHKDGYGLNNLDARTKLMQGTITIHSQPGKGTSVLVQIPYDI